MQGWGTLRLRWTTPWPAGGWHSSLALARPVQRAHPFQVVCVSRALARAASFFFECAFFVGCSASSSTSDQLAAIAATATVCWRRFCRLAVRGHVKAGIDHPRGQAFCCPGSSCEQLGLHWLRACQTGKGRVPRPRETLPDLRVTPAVLTRISRPDLATNARTLFNLFSAFVLKRRDRSRRPSLCQLARSRRALQQPSQPDDARPPETTWGRSFGVGDGPREARLAQPRA